MRLASQSLARGLAVVVCCPDGRLHESGTRRLRDGSRSRRSRWGPGHVRSPQSACCGDRSPRQGPSTGSCDLETSSSRTACSHCPRPRWAGYPAPWSGSCTTSCCGGTGPRCCAWFARASTASSRCRMRLRPRCGPAGWPSRSCRTECRGQSRDGRRNRRAGDRLRWAADSDQGPPGADGRRREARSEVTLELAGDAFPKDAGFVEQLRARAAAPDLAGRVHFLGRDRCPGRHASLDDRGEREHLPGVRTARGAGGHERRGASRGHGHRRIRRAAQRRERRPGAARIGEALADALREPTARPPGEDPLCRAWSCAGGRTAPQDEQLDSLLDAVLG